MALFELPVLGPTEFKTSQYQTGSWSVEFPLHDGDVSVSFYADGPEMTEALLRRVEKFLAHIGDFDRLARAVIREDYASGEGAKSRRFLSYNLENFSPAMRLQCFGTDDVSSIGVEHLLAALNPLQVALRPEEQDRESRFLTTSWAPVSAIRYSALASTLKGSPAVWAGTVNLLES